MGILIKTFMEAPDTKKVLTKIGKNIVQPIAKMLPPKHRDSFTQWAQNHKQDFLQTILALPLSSEYNPAWMPLTQNGYQVICQWILSWAADLQKNTLQRTPRKSPTVSPITCPAEAKDAVERSIVTLEARSEVEAFWSGSRPGWVTAPLVTITHTTPSVAEQLPRQLPPKGRTLDEVLAALASQLSVTQDKPRRSR